MNSHLDMNVVERKASYRDEVFRAIKFANGGALNYHDIKWSNAAKYGEDMGYITRVGKNRTKGWVVTELGTSSAWEAK